jgi:hypothetical protein
MRTPFENLTPAHFANVKFVTEVRQYQDMPSLCSAFTELWASHVGKMPIVPIHVLKVKEELAEIRKELEGNRAQSGGLEIDRTIKESQKRYENSKKLIEEYNWQIATASAIEKQTDDTTKIREDYFKVLWKQMTREAFDETWGEQLGSTIKEMSETSSVSDPSATDSDSEKDGHLRRLNSENMGPESPTSIDIESDSPRNSSSPRHSLGDSPELLSRKPPSLPDLNGISTSKEIQWVKV